MIGVLGGLINDEMAREAIEIVTPITAMDLC